MDIKAQGALEYLIIIAAVLAIAAIIVTILTGILGGRQEAQLVTEAKEAAASCNQALTVNWYTPGEEDGNNLCDEICQGDWVGSDAVGIVGGVQEISNPQDACNYGMPRWIVEAGEAQR